MNFSNKDLSAVSDLIVTSLNVNVNSNDFMIINFGFELLGDFKCNPQDHCLAYHLKKFNFLVVQFLSEKDNLSFSISNFINPNHTLLTDTEGWVTITYSKPDTLEKKVYNCLPPDFLNFKAPNQIILLKITNDINQINTKSRFYIELATNFSDIGFIIIRFPPGLVFLSDGCFGKAGFQQINVFQCRIDMEAKIMKINITPNKTENIKMLIETKEDAVINIGSDSPYEFTVEGYHNDLLIENYFLYGKIVIDTFKFSPEKSKYEFLDFFDYETNMFEDEIYQNKKLYTAKSALKFSICPNQRLNNGNPVVIITIMPVNNVNFIIDSTKVGNVPKQKLLCLVDDVSKVCSYKKEYENHAIKIDNLVLEQDQTYIIYLTVVDSFSNLINDNGFEAISNALLVHVYFCQQYDDLSLSLLLEMHSDLFMIHQNIFFNFNLEYLTTSATNTNMFYISFVVKEAIDCIIIEFPTITFDRRKAWDPTLGGFNNLNKFPCTFGLNNIKITETAHCYFVNGDSGYSGYPAKVYINNFLINDLNIMNEILIAGFANPSEENLYLPLKIYGYRKDQLIYYQETKELFKTTPKVFAETSGSTQRLQKSIFSDNNYIDLLTVFSPPGPYLRFLLVEIVSNECYFEADYSNHFILSGFRSSQFISYYIIKSSFSSIKFNLAKLEKIKCISCISSKFILHTYALDGNSIKTITLDPSKSYMNFLEQIAPLGSNTEAEFGLVVNQMNFPDNSGILILRISKYKDLLEQEKKVSRKLAMKLVIKTTFFKVASSCQVIQGMTKYNLGDSIECKIEVQSSPDECVQMIIRNFDGISSSQDIFIYMKFEIKDFNGLDSLTKVVGVSFYFNYLACLADHSYIYFEIQTFKFIKRSSSKASLISSMDVDSTVTPQKYEITFSYKLLSTSDPINFYIPKIYEIDLNVLESFSVRTDNVEDKDVTSYYTPQIDIDNRLIKLVAGSNIPSNDIIIKLNLIFVTKFVVNFFYFFSTTGWKEYDYYTFTINEKSDKYKDTNSRINFIPFIANKETVLKLEVLQFPLNFNGDAQILVLGNLYFYIFS